MKIHVVLFCCLCRGLAMTEHFKPSESANTQEYKEFLKDIRMVSINKLEPLQKPVLVKEQNEYLKQAKPTAQLKVTRKSLGISGGEKKKVGEASQARIGDSLREQMQNNQAHMQKIANQLYLAQKRASLLSKYQKFILSQDSNVKDFVLGQLIQNKSPKPFSSQRPTGRSLSPQWKVKYISTEPPTPESIALGKIVVVTPKVQTAVEKVSKSQNDHKAQGTRVKYVTLAPQSLTHLADTHKPGHEITLLPYTPHPYTYYNLGATSKPQIKTAQIPATASFGLRSNKLLQPQYHHDEGVHEDNLNYDNSKYEFKYKVKDRQHNSHFGHKESRSDQTTYGYYFVQLPDGRLETVKYWADKTGYHAKVDYQGQAEHPTQTEHKVNSFNIVYH